MRDQIGAVVVFIDSHVAVHREIHERGRERLVVVAHLADVAK